nr:MAG: DNA pilot protein [Microvirus sp.]
MFPDLGQALTTYGGTKFSAEKSKQAARKQRAFIERMSNTAHQREQKDLIAAGLNPILTATKGGPGASTGSPGIASVPDFGKVGDAFGKNSGFEVQKAIQDLKNAKELGVNIAEDSHLKFNQAQMQRLMQEGQKYDNVLTRMRIPGQRKEAAMDTSAFGTFTRGLGRITGATGRGSTGN